MMEERYQRMGLLPVGDSEQSSKTITEPEVYLFAGVTGDLHPLVMDEPLAMATAGGRIVMPSLAVGLVSGVLSRFSRRVPAPGVVSVLYDLREVNPLRVDDTVTVTLQVAEHRRERFEVVLRATCTNQRQETVLDGECVIKVL